MKNVTLQFSSNHILWLFRRTISLEWLRVNPDLRTLTCACSDKDINVAVCLYEAKIIETESFVGLEV